MPKAWTELFGADATFGSDVGGVYVKFYADDMVAATGITAANINNANAAEKMVATLVKFWASLTYTETNNITVAADFTDLNVVQRNGSAKWTKGYDIALFASATGIPTSIDPDDV